MLPPMFSSSHSFAAFLMKSSCHSVHLAEGMSTDVALWQVRDFEYNAEKQASQRDSAEQLKQEAEQKRSSLEQWSASAYGEVGPCLRAGLSADAWSRLQPRAHTFVEHAHEACAQACSMSCWRFCLLVGCLLECR